MADKIVAYNIMIRRIIISFMIFFLIPSYAQEIRQDKSGRVPVIAITAIANYTYPQESHDIMAIRDKVVSELVRNYECVVISRSNGFTLATENALGKMIAVNADSVQIVDNIPAADFAITGYFKVVKYEPKWATLGCTLLITDLTEKSKADFQKAEFVPNEDTNFSPDITSKIVEMLKLKPKRKVEPSSGVLDETWAILPVSHLESFKQMGQPADKALAISMELSLQESKKVKKIVDHNELDKVLLELELSSLSGATESLAGGIAGIIGADRIVIGTVSRPSRKNNNVRLDLLLVDGRKAVVLDSTSAECKKDELDQTASKLILQLTDQQHLPVELNNASGEIRKKECKLYLGVFDSIPTNISYTASVDLGISWAEAAYMLVPDEPAETFEIAKKLFERILCGYTYSSSTTEPNSRVDISDKLPKLQVKKITTAIDKLLQPESKFTKPQYPLIIRADSYRLLGDYDKALNLINKHISQYPDTERAYTFSVLGNIYYSQKDYQKAEACIAECKKDKLGVELGLNLYKALGNEKKELEYLKEQGKYYYLWDVARCLNLIRKLEGPKAVIEYSDRRPLWSSDTDRPEVQLEFAKTYLELGDKRKAAVILKNANNEGLFKSPNSKCYNNPEYTKKIKSEIQDLIRQLGASETQWKKAFDIVKIPGKYKIYIQPIGMTDLSTIQNAIPRIEEFWGCRVEILPVLPLPEDPCSFNKEKGQYDTRLLVDRILQTSKAPEDSIYTRYTTDKDTFIDAEYIRKAAKIGRKYIWARSETYQLDKSISRDLAKIWSTNKTKTHDDYKNNPYFGECDNFSCCFSSFGDMKDKNFALCETCQKKLKNVNFDELKSFWDKTLKLEEVTDPDEKKWIENYRVKVLAALKKAEAEKKESREKVEILPSVNISDTKPGLSCAYYEFEKDKVKNTNQLADLQPLKSAVNLNFAIEPIERKENFGLVFTGFIKVPADDVYTFYLSSDDGSSMTVDDLKIIDNNGTKGIVTKTGSIALKAGLHPLRLAYFQGSGDKFLEIYWRSEKHLIGQRIPNEALSHK